VSNLTRFDDPQALLAVEVRLSREIIAVEQHAATVNLDSMNADYARSCALALVGGPEALKPPPGPVSAIPGPSSEQLAALSGIRARRFEVLQEQLAAGVATAKRAVTKAQAALDAHRAKLAPLLAELEALDGSPFMRQFDYDVDLAWEASRGGVYTDREVSCPVPVTNRLVGNVEAAQAAVQAAEARRVPVSGAIIGVLHSGQRDGAEIAWMEQFAQRPDLYGPSLLDVWRWQRDTLKQLEPHFQREQPHALRPGWRFTIGYRDGQLTETRLERFDRRPDPEPAAMAA
jgi:hypothetical protein